MASGAESTSRSGIAAMPSQAYAHSGWTGRSRRVQGHYPDEVAPLVRELNDVLDMQMMQDQYDQGFLQLATALPGDEVRRKKSNDLNARR